MIIICYRPVISLYFYF